MHNHARNETMQIASTVKETVKWTIVEHCTNEAWEKQKDSKQLIFSTV